PPEERIALQPLGLLDSHFGDRCSISLESLPQLGELRAKALEYYANRLGSAQGQDVVQRPPAQGKLDVAELMKAVRTRNVAEIEKSLPPVSHQPQEQRVQAGDHLAVPVVPALGRCAHDRGAQPDTLQGILESAGQGHGRFARLISFLRLRSSNPSSGAFARPLKACLRRAGLHDGRMAQNSVWCPPFCPSFAFQ